MPHSIRWAPRISRNKLRQLYETYMSGVVDEELLDDVGMTLYMRCKDIVAIAEAQAGRVRCPECYGRGVETIIPGGYFPCQQCSWTSSWDEFSASYRRKQLNAGGALKAFEDYVLMYPMARTIDRKMALIDRLIHEFHYSLKADPSLPTRSVGPNLIDANLKEVMRFLNDLNYGKEELLASGNHERWVENARRWQRWLDELNAE